LSTGHPDGQDSLAYWGRSQGLPLWGLEVKGVGEERTCSAGRKRKTFSFGIAPEERICADNILMKGGKRLVRKGGDGAVGKGCNNGPGWRRTVTDPVGQRGTEKREKRANVKG